MEENNRGLAQRLMDLEECALALMETTSNPEQKKSLSDLCDTLSDVSNRLIRENLKASAREYQEVAEGLESASVACREAIKDVNSIQTALNALAGAADLAARIAIA